MSWFLLIIHYFCGCLYLSIYLVRLSIPKGQKLGLLISFPKPLVWTLTQWYRQKPGLPLFSFKVKLWYLKDIYFPRMETRPRGPKCVLLASYSLVFCLLGFIWISANILKYGTIKLFTSNLYWKNKNIWQCKSMATLTQPGLSCSLPPRWSCMCFPISRSIHPADFDYLSGFWRQAVPDPCPSLAFGAEMIISRGQGLS